jgi:hypothetical protein
VVNLTGHARIGPVSTYRFRGELWLYKGTGPWHFITLPFDMTDEIDEVTTGRQGGFGSVRVAVTIGGSRWSTSLFPASEAESFILPVKKQVRTAEGIAAGDMVDVELRLIDS